jgi:hypothetical protein
VTGPVTLERWYRRLLACYPRRFRDELGEEMITVLLAGARPGQRHPGLIETADMAGSGLLMRLRPGPSQAARQDWADALATFSVAGPVFLLLTFLAALVPLQAVLFHSSLPGAGLAMLHRQGFWIMLGLQVLVVALVLAGQRTAALAAMALTAVYLYSGDPLVTMMWWWPSPALLIGVYLVAAAALFSSPGPRHGRHLVHWGHGVVLLAAAAAVRTFAVMPGFDPRSPLALVIGIAFTVAIAWLSLVTRLGRYFRLLLAAMFYPTAVSLAAAGFGWDTFYWLPWPQYFALLYAGPLLTAALAMISATRPRRRQII